MKTYKNRYGNVFIFSEDENKDILWEGEFTYCRIGFPNDYTRAYTAYLEDREGVDEDKILSLEEFKRDVHVYQGDKHLYPDYIKMVDSLTNEIDMVDPSGGPYISRGSNLTIFGFKDYIVKDFKRIDTGYKIIVEKCPICRLPAGNHKMSCTTRKITVFIKD